MLGFSVGYTTSRYTMSIEQDDYLGTQLPYYMALII